MNKGIASVPPASLYCNQSNKSHLYAISPLQPNIRMCLPGPLTSCCSLPTRSADVQHLQPFHYQTNARVLTNAGERDLSYQLSLRTIWQIAFICSVNYLATVHSLQGKSKWLYLHYLVGNRGTVSLSNMSSWVCGRAKIRTQDFLAFSHTPKPPCLELSFLPKTGQSPEVTFLSILTCTCDSVNAKHGYRPCTYTPTFTVLVVRSSLSLSCHARTQPAPLMHKAQFLFLQSSELC